ncbi:MAG: hypothetical protein AUK48_07360 [Oscillatoriales cyanobacterium CG2_30_44_21]|nr:MAG: hypothetical protein AUK48_07360 [Oscillatoriales cyanobacterium CG2_30_44_21]
MTDDPDVSENTQSDQIPESPLYVGSRIKFFPRVKLPNFRSFRLGKRNLDGSTKKQSYLWLWLLLILLSYTCIGYFLSVLLTSPDNKHLAIAGFVVVSLLPTLTAFADFALIKWGYLISGFLIVGGLIFLAGVPFYLTALAIIAWVGVTLIAFVGDYLLRRNHKLVQAIAMVTVPCLAGLGIGWQIWKLIAKQ